MLRLQDVSITRGGLLLLEGVTFGLQAGQALVISGPNGVGKTSLLRTIIGLNTPAAGKIEWDHAPVYLAHQDALKPTLTVGENLEFWAGVYQSIHTLLDVRTLLELKPLWERPLGTLSAGQRRRVGLARICVAKQRLWVLDEPTVSLDTRGLTMFQKVLAEHLMHGGSAILSSHVDMGIKAQTLDLSRFKASVSQIFTASAFDEVLE